MEKLDKAIAILMEHDQESLFALADIAEERARQITAEGCSPSHDDEHGNRQMARAAAAYAAASAIDAYPENNHIYRGRLQTIITNIWPWSREWWKPKSPQQDCVRAGALLVSELARIYRIGSRAALANAGNDR